ncbi:MAG: hypothetical protein K6L74_08650 [Neptuniibacter sp.]
MNDLLPVLLVLIIPGKVFEPIVGGGFTYSQADVNSKKFPIADALISIARDLVSQWSEDQTLIIEGKSCLPPHENEVLAVAREEGIELDTYFNIYVRGGASPELIDRLAEALTLAMAYFMKHASIRIDTAGSALEIDDYDSIKILTSHEERTRFSKGQTFDCLYWTPLKRDKFFPFNCEIEAYEPALGKPFTGVGVGSIKILSVDPEKLKIVFGEFEWIDVEESKPLGAVQIPELDILVGLDKNWFRGVRHRLTVQRFVDKGHERHALLAIGPYVEDKPEKYDLMMI